MGKIAATAERKPQPSAPPDPNPDPGPIATPPQEVKVGKPAAATSDDWFGDFNAADDKVKALWYGVEGTGKTSAATMAANLGRILVINAESGLKFVALRNLGVNVENIRVWPNPKDPQPITAATLEALHIRVLSDLHRDPDSWFAVVFDSLTEIHTALREQATDRRVSKVQGVDPDWVDRDDYGVMTNQLRKIIRRFRDLPCHVLFTALETHDEKKDEIRPAITPALCQDVMGYVDMVMRMGSATDDFRARTKKFGRVRAKDRYNVLPDRLIDPNFVRVHAYLNGQLTADADDKQDLIRTEDQAKAAAEAAAAVAELEKPKGRTRPSRAKPKAADPEPKPDEPAVEPETTE